jgi:O-antigen/teichoic acid export membrane protein
MSTDEVKQAIWRNAASNYLCLALRLVLGLIMFRLLYRSLTREEFGFWSLLWSVFGYGILLDFGFGFTVQKRVAELSVHRDWTRLSQVLSTVFYTYLVIGAAVALAGLVASRWLIDWFHVAPQNRESFRQVLVCFACGLGLGFPLGLFPEMLRGQQRIALGNLIFSGGMLINFGFSVLAIERHWGLKALVLIAVICTSVPDLLCGVFALRQLPAVRIRPKHFSPSMIRDTVSFSVFAYLTTVSNVILAKTDQLVITSAIALSAVAVYQAAAKVGEMFGGVSQQLPDAFSPAAAHLHAKGDRAVLRDMLINGTRFSVMVATPLYLVCAFYMDGLLRLLTGEALPVTFWAGQVLLFWSYTTVVTQSVAKRIYMMCGHERKLMYLAVGEALLNLALSIGLVAYYRSVICVAVGSLASTCVFGWLILWPWAAREAELSAWRLACLVLGPAWLACLPLLAFVGFDRIVPLLETRKNSLVLFLEGGLALTLGFLGMWRIALTELERSKLAAALGKTWAKWRLA